LYSINVRELYCRFNGYRARLALRECLLAHLPCDPTKGARSLVQSAVHIGEAADLPTGSPKHSLVVVIKCLFRLHVVSPSADYFPMISLTSLLFGGCKVP